MAEQQNNDYEYTDVDGLNLTVTAGGSGNRGSGELLPEKEWMPAILREIKQKHDKKKDIKRLTWRFELQGEDYSYEDEESGWIQEVVLGSTSKATSAKSKLYGWYCTLTGVESLDVGEVIQLPGLIGLRCDVMVETIKDAAEPFQLVSDIRLPKQARRRGRGTAKTTEPAAKTATPSTAATAAPEQAAGAETEPADPGADEVPF